MHIRYILLCALSFLFVLSACKHKPPYVVDPKVDYGNYPEAIGKIMVTRCATAGCHNEASYSGAGGLRLDKWEHLFNGGGNGAAVVPYSTEFSPLLYFINTHSELGVISEPRMPYMAAPLSKDEYLLIRDWVEKGAPDKNGNIPFAANADTRQKIYLTQQGCDLVAVIDAEKRVIMRYIKVGGEDGVIESPHSIRITKDGKYAYVCFSQGGYLQKIDTRTDKVVGSVNLGVSQWNALAISPDDKKVLVADMGRDSRVALVDVENMKFLGMYGKLPNGNIQEAHGVAWTAKGDSFLVSSQTGNVIYKYGVKAFLGRTFTLDNKPPTNITSLDPHEILMAPDNSKYFVTCQKSNEVRVMDANTDQLIDVIQVGNKPQEMAISKKYPYMFVTCLLGDSPYSAGNVQYQGSVYVINYKTNQFVARIDNTFTQPHGVTVDDANDAVYIASINPTGAGPAPHHVSSCEGKNGYYQVFDLKTFQKLPNTRNKYEVTVAPYAAATRFE
jgi:YVTN family beta-propeller protein